VKAVVNPIAATGGAGADTVDQMRANVPIAAMGLDRVVSLQDYADFARRFAGVAKAWADRTVDGGQRYVHVTIAGVDDAIITPDSDVHRNLLEAFARSGDEAQPVKLDTRARMVLVLSAFVTVDPDYGWDLTEPRIRKVLGDRFGFERMQLEDNLFQSDVLAAIQSVPGVLGVRVETFGAVPTQGADGEELPPSMLSEEVLRLVKGGSVDLGWPRPALGVRRPGTPARLAYFVPAIPETIVLTEVSS
jgi:predicted phage baseplate assembly protein